MTLATFSTLAASRWNQGFDHIKALAVYTLMVQKSERIVRVSGNNPAYLQKVFICKNRKLKFCSFSSTNSDVRSPTNIWDVLLCLSKRQDPPKHDVRKPFIISRGRSACCTFGQSKEGFTGASGL